MIFWRVGHFWCLRRDKSGLYRRDNHVLQGIEVDDYGFEVDTVNIFLQND